jgi:hypothetical protein
VLLEKYPNNLFLNKSICKALYGLSYFKAYDRYHYVARSFTKIEGESQQVHYLLRKFNKKQLLSLATKEIYEVYIKDKENIQLKAILKSQLRLLMLKGDLTTEDFLTDANECKKLYADMNAAFLKELKDKGAVSELRRMKIEGDFYKAALVTAKSDPDFLSIYNEVLQEKIKEEANANLPYKERQKIEYEKKRKNEKEPEIHAKNILFITPVLSYRIRKKEDLKDEKQKSENFEAALKNACSESNINVELISGTLSDKNIMDLNRSIEAMEWASENYADRFVPLSNEFANKVNDKNFDCVVMLYFNASSRTYYHCL